MFARRVAQPSCLFLPCCAGGLHHGVDQQGRGTTGADTGTESRAQPATATYSCADGGMITIENLGDVGARPRRRRRRRSNCRPHLSRSASRYGEQPYALVLDGREALFMKSGRAAFDLHALKAAAHPGVFKRLKLERLLAKLRGRNGFPALTRCKKSIRNRLSEVASGSGNAAFRPAAAETPNWGSHEQITSHPPAARAAAFAASDDLPAADHHDDVDHASHHRRRALFRHAAGRLVADRGGDLARAISTASTGSSAPGSAGSCCSATPGR